MEAQKFYCCGGTGFVEEGIPCRNCEQEKRMEASPYKQYMGEPWKNEQGHHNDTIVSLVMEEADLLIAGLQKFKEDCSQYYSKKDNELALRVNKATFGNTHIHSYGPGITELVNTFEKLGYIKRD